jgi:hypothetical protein
MTSTPFDPSQAIRFDLAQGSVALTGGAEAAAAVVPAHALSALVAAVARSGAAEAAFVAWGDALGQRVRQRLGDTAAASPETVLDHVGGELALAGLGVLGFERWGKALVLTVRDGALGANGDEALSVILRGLLSAATGRAVSIVMLGREERVARLLLTSEKGAEKALASLAEGTPWALVLAGLHGSPPASANPVAG